MNQHCEELIDKENVQYKLVLKIENVGLFNNKFQKIFIKSTIYKII